MGSFSYGAGPSVGGGTAPWRAGPAGALCRWPLARTACGCGRRRRRLSGHGVRRS